MWGVDIFVFVTLCHPRVTSSESGHVVSFKIPLWRRDPTSCGGGLVAASLSCRGDDVCECAGGVRVFAAE